MLEWVPHHLPHLVTHQCVLRHSGLISRTHSGQPFGHLDCLLDQFVSLLRS